MLQNIMHTCVEACRSLEHNFGLMKNTSYDTYFFEIFTAVIFWKNNTQLNFLFLDLGFLDFENVYT